MSLDSFQTIFMKKLVKMGKLRSLSSTWNSFQGSQIWSGWKHLFNNRQSACCDDSVCKSSVNVVFHFPAGLVHTNMKKKARRSQETHTNSVQEECEWLSHTVGSQYLLLLFFLLTNVYLNHLLTANSSHCVLCVRLDFSALLCWRCGFRYSALTVKKKKISN